MSFIETFTTLLAPYLQRVEDSIRKSIHHLPSSPEELKKACSYALSQKGKRFRPIIVYLVAEGVGKPHDVQGPALAVEYFHTASLIADDLPCMDDEEYRRHQLTLHRQYNEATALLVTYSLISAGYQFLNQNVPSSEVLSLALECATRTTGLLGASGGQFLDLFPPSPLHEKDVLEIIEKKTGALFELSFVLGWLYGGGEIEKLPLVKEAAYAFGMAFQIVDDFLDLEEDLKGKGRLNYVACVGPQKAREVLERELTTYYQKLKELQLHQPILLQLGEAIEKTLYSAPTSTSSS